MKEPQNQLFRIFSMYIVVEMHNGQERVGIHG